ncbi:ATP-dependent endonuclease [Arthrobacter psychrolactophilus]|uniref:ATP-dependent endonuclease n=1 Tax=Arthrobacter psychrolactophilus TaxID=92442 RepID=A0A2V5IVT7_9MICC|nr:AAA family ATPase [Arthrobacter psychrolactophilus]PYI39562.1 ATP-dependent endonuclease [Arthrobacter psychrolactophilus]
MYLSQIQIQNFRQFGASGLLVEFQPGVVALAGPNDSGKTAIVDAIRYVLTTKDQEYISIQPEDFHVSRGGGVSKDITLTCRFSGLSTVDRSTFLEYLTPAEDGELVFYLQWKCVKKTSSSSRRWNEITLKSGREGQGPAIDSATKQLLACAYLRPLRDAEREMSSGRNSRLSQVLNKFPDISSGATLNADNLPGDIEAVESLSLAGLSGYIRHLVNRHDGVKAATTSINNDYLSKLSLVGDGLTAEINFVSGPDDITRLKQILERLELNLLDGASQSSYGRYGLGSNNLLYMACELLLIAKEREGLPLLLIEEPEAHLHPQRQLQLMSFLESRVTGQDEQPPVQVIISTHSPVLASKVKVENVVLVNDGQAFSLAQDRTMLSKSDYGFLARFLDATKSNLFFAQGVLVVEGDAEKLLLPTIARLIGRDLTEFGVSIVNVGSTGLRRYTRIFQRKLNVVPEGAPEQTAIRIPIASIGDRDIMPNRAPEILNYVKDLNDEKWSSSRRKWRIEDDQNFLSDPSRPNKGEYEMGRISIIEKLTADDGQHVRTFYADHWTFEYDLARAGLAKQVFVAAKLAQADDGIHEALDSAVELVRVKAASIAAFELLQAKHPDKEILSIYVYREFVVGKASKAIAAQYMAQLLEDEFTDQSEKLNEVLPDYLKAALTYVTTAHNG